MEFHLHKVVGSEPSTEGKFHSVSLRFIVFQVSKPSFTILHISLRILDVPFSCVMYFPCCALPNTLFPIGILEKENMMFHNRFLINFESFNNNIQEILLFSFYRKILFLLY